MNGLHSRLFPDCASSKAFVQPLSFKVFIKIHFPHHLFTICSISSKIMPELRF